MNCLCRIYSSQTSPSNPTAGIQCHQPETSLLPTFSGLMQATTFVKHWRLLEAF